MKKGIAFGLVSLLWFISLKGQDNFEALGSIEPYMVTADDGNTYSGEIGSLKVPENRANPKSKFIEIPYFRIKTKNPII